MAATDMLRGRQTATRTLTNKSGGAVALGDVVVIGDATNDNAFTTTTTASFNARMVGVAMEAIANNAAGLVAIHGYVPIVNTNASVARDVFLFTHTVAKEATGSATRAAGAFGQVLETGADPEAIIWGMPDATAGSAGAPTDATYVTTSANGTLSAEVVHPEFGDNVSGSAVDMSAAATGTGVTANAQTGYAGRVEFTASSSQYWDVASAAGTGDFDYRARVVTALAATPAGTANPLIQFGVEDSARTDSTALHVRLWGVGPATTVQYVIGRINAEAGIRLSAPTYPIILRVARVSGTVTWYVSLNDGVSWATLHSVGANSLNVARVGFYVHANSNTKGEILVHYVRSV